MEEEEKMFSHQYSVKLGNSCQILRPQWIKSKALAVMFCPQFCTGLERVGDF